MAPQTEMIDQNINTFSDEGELDRDQIQGKDDAALLRTMGYKPVSMETYFKFFFILRIHAFRSVIYIVWLIYIFLHDRFFIEHILYWRTLLQHLVSAVRLKLCLLRLLIYSQFRTSCFIFRWRCKSHIQYWHCCRW